ncbi:MAG: sugar phosphate isomerase/epimerase [Clostridiales bacterium]|nr:sugar phosphate isomerase/epimerase [Clostridiales bacterium]
MAFVLSAFADEADRSLAGQLEALHECGVGQIELRGIDGKSVAALTDAEAARVRDRLAGEGIGISAMGSPYGKYPIDRPLQPHIDDFRRGLDICRLLGADRIRMFSFYLPAGQPAEDWRAKVFDGIDQMLNLAREAGVRLAHENERGIYGDNLERCEDLMHQFGESMGLIFDPANFVQCGVRPAAAFPRLSKWLEYLHVKDARMGTGAVVPSGAGDGDVAMILRALADRPGDITLTIEPHLKVFEGLANLQAEPLEGEYAYPDSRSAFRAAVGALKGLLTEMGYSEGGRGIWIR